MSPDLWNRFDHPLRLELGDSPVLRNTLAAIHLVAVGAWLLAPLPLSWRVSALAVLLVQGRRLYHLHVCPTARSAVRALCWDADEGWRLKTASGWRAATLCHPFYVTAHLAAARFRIGRFRRLTVIVTGDRADADSFRRLRVRLLQCAHGRGDRTKVSGQ